MLTTSMKVGHGNDVSVNLGPLFDILKADNSNVLLVRPNRPELSAGVALGPRLRWRIDRLDWEEDAEYVDEPAETSFRKSSMFTSHQAMQLLHEDIPYDRERSLYYYITGMLLQPKNWFVDARLEIELGASYYDLRRMDKFNWSTDSLRVKETQETDGRYVTAKAVFGYGVNRKMQLLVGWALERGNAPSSDSYQLFSRTESDSLVRGSLYSSTWIDRNYEVFVEPTYLLSSRHWISLHPSFTSYRQAVDAMDRECRGRDDELGRNSREVLDIRTYGISMRHSWISSGTQIPMEQILDNHSGYYGARLSQGSIQVKTGVDLQFTRRTSLDWSYPQGSSIGNFKVYKRRDDQLSATLEATYCAPLNFDLSLRLSLSRSCNGYNIGGSYQTFSHSQANQIVLDLSYYSYRWTPGTRQSVGWNGVSDIDYIYGPLLLPRDWRASIRVEPPVHKWSGNTNKESIFNFYKGESDNYWTYQLSGGLGLCEGLELGLDVTYRQRAISEVFDSRFPYWSRSYSWLVTPHVRWQPCDKFRMDFTVSEDYYDYRSIYHFENGGILNREYNHYWRISVAYDILI